jgi:excisionase family DNA binding protein
MSDKFLTTRDAARYLQASEASIRRWADAGLLPAGRVGVRKARRFREADLTQFIGRRDRDEPRSMTGAPTVTLHGRAVSVSSHLAGFYGTDTGRLRQGLPLLLDGLASDQPCLLFATTEIQEKYARALREQKVEVRSAVKNGRFRTITPARDTPEAWIAKLETMLTDIARRRSGPVRFVAEVTAGLKSTGSRTALLHQEQLLTTLVKGFPVVLLCLYDVREFDGPLILEALKLHYETFDYGFAYFLS